MKLRSPRERERLKRLIEAVATQVFHLKQRGLLLCVEEIETHGRAPSEIRVWATLHFLASGSPFCCTEAGCHLFVAPDRPHPIGEALRRRLQLTQAVDFKFAALHSVVHPGVLADYGFGTGAPADVKLAFVERENGD
jgi:hypothetical protein